MVRTAAALLLLSSACAPDDGWAWVDVDDTACANGRPTGFGLRPGEGEDLVIYLMGGGACWDAATCYGLQTAWNVSTGYTRETFAAEARRSAGIFEPFSNATHVYVPYCTGDLHAGTATREHLAGTKTHHVGANNLDAVLARLDAPRGRVFVVGTSAGGYGAQLNAARFVARFEGHEVHVLADSAPLVADDKLEGWKATWGATDQSALPQGSRLGLVASRRDWLISSFVGLSPEQYEAKLLELVATRFDAPPARMALVVDGNQHVFFDAAGLPGVNDFVERWRDGVMP
ncbi:MAG: hypothetical protein JNK82_41190 [Myxococcaceae bacterium]|nr:hypothetical protein [Myxococcaceae bacterium]